MNDTQLSKFMSLVLRHQPEVAGITLDEEGWASVEALLESMQRRGMPVDLDRLRHVVASSDKQRYAFNEEGNKIRANQGHSIPVDLGLEPIAPLPLLYHGSAEEFLSRIRKEGLQRKSRQWVHLSEDPETALRVGKRHGKPLVLQVNSQKMYQDGYPFYRSVNGIWLTERVPPEYLMGSS
jgi:putative RNA 2'-phosphotransferase